jgi:hypothetical protein
MTHVARPGPAVRWGAGVPAVAAAVVLGLCGFPRGTLAYTAAGDRLFPATAVLPQIAPGDEFYTWGWTVPLAGGPVGAPERASNFAAVYSKTITERLGITVEDTWKPIDRVGRGRIQGWTNFEAELKYLVIQSQPQEFLMTLGLNREFATGAQRIGASPKGATEPRVYFGKGFGDLDIGYLRPLAVTGQAGYQFADAPPRGDRVNLGFVVEYSIPYLQSKVSSFDLPEIIRGLTPMTEVSIGLPAGRSFGAPTTVMFSPGVSYAGEGWEFHLAALVPATRATAAGAGVIAQLHLSLDYLFPETIGRPLFSER